jgi:hypothetical protein
VQALDLSVSTPPSTYDAGQYVTTDQLTLMPGGTVSSFITSNNLLVSTNFTPADIVTSSMPNFTTYKTTVSGAPIELDIYKTGSSNTELALTYTDLGIWSEGAQQPTQVFNNYHYFVFGMPTPQAIISGQTGSAQYTGVVYGGAVDVTQMAQYNLTGTSSFDVNFSTQTLSGDLNLTGTRVGGGPTATFDNFTFAGAIPASNSGTNALTITQDGVNVGQIQSQFFGPRSEEIGGIFSINEPSGAVIEGATVAKRH